MVAGIPAAAEAGMYYAGTSNNWTFQPMNYDRVWGTSGGSSLCTDQNRCGDIRLDGYGQHRLYVGRHGSWWRLDGNGNGYSNDRYNNGGSYYGNQGSSSTYNAGQLYYAGTSNGWSFTPMNRSGSSWYVDVYLSGNGDNGGSQRFKITDSSGWNGNVWESLRRHQDKRTGAVQDYRERQQMVRAAPEQREQPQILQRQQPPLLQ